MPSILPGYNYDIFISYRHKDNKYDGWVTEFVQNLRKELDATFKDDISIYFDYNPDDGLLETYNVDKSLEGKLNCLIFIPVLSQTYCDPRSFSWQHEFKAFNEFAKADTFGRDIHLRNGNVASRILPIRVRDLDAEDKKMLEDELGSVLRPIDFIYKEQGVNRPLKPEDSEEKNQNHTKYRNQINKTANAIKEVITAIKWKQSGAKEPPPAPVETVADVPEEAQIKKPSRFSSLLKSKKKRSPLEIILRFGIAALVLFFIFYKDGKDKKQDKDKDEDQEIVDKSIAVLPFEDLSAAKDQEYFSDGIAEEILNSLAHIKGLKVAGRTSSFQFKGQKVDLTEVGEKLNVAHVLEGSVRKVGNKVRITAQLIGVKDGFHIWSETYDRDMTDIFAIQDEVANKIASVLLKELAVVKPTTDRPENVKAYEYYLEGKYINLHRFVVSGKKEDFDHAVALFKKSMELDSTYALTHAGLADLYNSYTNTVKRDTLYMRLQQKEIDIAYRLNPNLDYVHNVIGNVELTKGNYEQAYHAFMKAVEINPKEGNNLMALSVLLGRLGLLDEAKIIMDRAVLLEPLESSNYAIRGLISFQMGHIDDAIADWNQALKEPPENYSIVVQLSFLYLAKKDMVEAKKYMDRALEINNKVTNSVGLVSAYDATLGYKEKALANQPSFRTYLILGMKKEAVEGILKLFSPKPPANIYLTLMGDQQIQEIATDPRMEKLLETQKEGYEKNKAKFKPPVLPEDQ